MKVKVHVTGKWMCFGKLEVFIGAWGRMREQVARFGCFRVGACIFRPKHVNRFFIVAVREAA